MPTLVPVDNDPFATATPQAGAVQAPAAAPVAPQDAAAPPVTIHGGVKLTPVDHDPFAAGAQGQGDGPSTGAGSSFIAGALNGAPIVGPFILGGAQRLSAFERSMDNGTKYADELARVQAADATRQDQHPVASTLGQMAGAGVALAPAIAAAPAWFGAEAAGGLTAGKVAAGAASGAGIGGTDAAVRSGGDPASIALGTIGGSLAGAAGPVIGAGLGRMGEAVADWRASRGALDGMGVSRPAAEILTRAGQTDGTLGGQGVANIQAAGPSGMLADSGPGMQNVLDTAIQRGGPGAVAARQAVDQSAGLASGDLNTAMDQTLGQPQGIETATNAIRDSTATARSTAYDAAYAQPIDYTTRQGRALETLVRARVPASVISRANNLMRVEGAQSKQILAHVADDGSVVYERLPDVRQLDYITRALNDVSQRGDGMGALGGNTAEGRAYGNLSKAIRGQLRQAVPEYATALDTAAEPIQAKQALEFGANMLRSTVARDEVKNAVDGMSASELRQVRLGLRAQMAETLSNIERTITDPHVDARQAMAIVKEFSSDAAREKLRMIISPAEEKALTQALTRAAKALELRASVASNSKTGARAMTHEVVKAAAAPGPVGKLLAGEPLKAGKAVAQFFTRTRPMDIARREDAIYSEVADHATRHKGQAAVSFLQQLEAAHTKRAAANSFARQIPYSRAASTGFLSLLPSLQSGSK